MGDSDEEFDRRGRRDKFRSERREYRDDREGGGGGGRGRGGGGGWEDRGRQEGADRGRGGGGDRYGGGREDYNRRRERAYSPQRNDMSPPAMKRQRRDWDEDVGGYRGGSYHDRGGGGGGYQGGHHGGGGAHHGGGGGGGGGNWGNSGNDNNSHHGGGGGGGNFNRGSDVDYPTQPAMMLFKHFLSQQEDTISDEDAIKKFNEYKVEFKKNQINEFFLQHKEEEWFKAKYHPEECDKRKSDHRTALKRRADIFHRLMELNYVENVTCDLEKYDGLVRLLDAAVILMEGGSEFDLTVLDGAIDRMNSHEGQRSRTASENVQNDRESVKVTFDKKEEEEPEGDGEIKDDDDEGDGEVEEPEKKEEPTENGDSAEKKSPEKEKENDEEGEEKKKKKKRNSDYNYESGSESDGSVDSTNEEKNTSVGDEKKEAMDTTEKKEPDEGDKEEGEEETQPRALHQTCSIFLRNLAPTITKQEVEAMCRRYPGFMRVALQDPQPERRFMRRGWVTFDRTVNIKDICWNLNNIRLRDCEMGAIVNRDLKQRVRPVNGLASHNTCIKQQIKLAAKIVQNFDKKWGLWEEQEEKKDQEKEVRTFGLVSNNPVLKNITDYLVEEGNYEEDELLGLPVDEKPKEANPEVEVERNEEFNGVLDRMILYLRTVHSFDFYSCVEYPNEDEMPHRCGIMHARGPVPPNRVTENDLKEWMAQFEMKLQPYIEMRLRLSEEEASKLGKKDPEAEVEKFVQANTQELAKDKWLCPLSGKKFKGPDFVRKHLFNKHEEKVEEVRIEVRYFNNYLMDPKRPQLPEHPSHRGGGPMNPGGGGGGYQRQDSYGPPQGGGYRGGYNNNRGGYGGHRGGYDGDGGGGGGYHGNYRGGFRKNFGYQNRGYQRGGYHNTPQGRGGGGYSRGAREDYSQQRDRRDSYPPRGFKDRGRFEGRAPHGYRDLDAPGDDDNF